MKEKIIYFLLENGLPWLIFILIILKLTKVINVSWWVVFSPWLIPAAIILFIVFFIEKMHKQ